MTNQQHPIIPPPKLVNNWIIEANNQDCVPYSKSIAIDAAQWGADQELEACCEWLAYEGHEHEHLALRASRRPKLPSLKEQALQVLASAPGPDYPRVMTVLNADEHALIRQALEALPND